MFGQRRLALPRIRLRFLGGILFLPGSLPAFGFVVSAPGVRKLLEGARLHLCLDRREARRRVDAERSEEISWTCTLSKPPLHCAAFVETMFGRLTLPQWLFASILGIAGGVYIYQPIFEQYSRDQQALKEELKVAQESEEKKN
ncbi:protein PIGBOS1 isoform X2 [Loxodonta africana]|uniref:protein PIGBOS1 isoform X2 n=1 Tax=Loxodonta africana TaxID=9785 RepID=UPI000C8112B9|nr:protein PIGBOS1 isoform X2 [Loxodonta africana]